MVIGTELCTTCGNDYETLCNSSELRAPSCRSSALASYLNTRKFHETSVSWEDQPATNAALRWIVHSGAAVVYRLEDKPRMSRQCVRSRAKRLDQTKDRRDLRSFPTSTKNGITMQDISSTLSWLSLELAQQRGRPSAANNVRTIRDILDPRRHFCAARTPAEIILPARKIEFESCK